MGYRGGVLRDQVRIYTSGTEAAQAVLKGEVTAAYVTRAQAEAAMFAAQVDRTPYGLTELGLPGLADNGWPIGMAVKADAGPLADALARALAELQRSGALARLYAEHGLNLNTP
jgi:ABC-type amino acid transport substrate-binding protein